MPGMSNKQPRTAEETTARNTTILVWALVWVPLAIGAVYLMVWGVNAFSEHEAAAKDAERAAQQASADAAYRQSKVDQLQPIRDALARSGFDPTTRKAGYGSVENFVEAQCQFMRMGLTTDQETQNLAGTSPMPTESARAIVNAVVGSGACS